MKTSSPKIILSLSLAAMLLSAGTSPAALLVGWYRFNDPTDLGKDYSGNNNTGTIVDNGAAPIYSASGYNGGAAGRQGFAGFGLWCWLVAGTKTQQQCKAAAELGNCWVMHGGLSNNANGRHPHRMGARWPTVAVKTGGRRFLGSTR